MRNKSWMGMLILFVLTIILDLLIGWPSALVAGIVVGFVFSVQKKLFRAGFAGAGLAWFLLALVPAIGAPGWLFAGKLVQITFLPSQFAILIFLLTGIVGGILGGLGWWIASLLKKY